MKPECHSMNLPERVRVSLGSAVVLGLAEAKLESAPTTVYLMTYNEGKCNANCGFCPQARLSRGRADMLSRVSWPVYPVQPVLNGVAKAFKKGRAERLCIQALNYGEVFKDLFCLVHAVHQQAKVPISISCQPLNSENLRQLAEAGADRIGIPLDAATEEIFDKIKGPSTGGPYRWKKQLDLLGEAVGVFGKGKVSTHLIVGLGETEKEMVSTIQKCVDMGVLPALFAFTPVAGTALEGNAPPSLPKYRRIQIARHLIVHGIIRFENIDFDKNDCIASFRVENEVLLCTIRSGKPFMTSGCSGCNRPYYNEKPSGPIYNYPRELTREEILEIESRMIPEKGQVS